VRVSLALALLTTSACSMAPKYVRTDLPVPPSWPVGDAYLRQSEAARTRLRPILMTSLAFIFGVLPLAISTGAGANSRIAIGTAVIGGMLSATFLAIFYIPLFFVLVRRGVRDGIAKLRGRPTGFQGKDDDDGGDAGDGDEPYGPPEMAGPHRPKPA